MKLALDAMGGDHAPAAVVEGALHFAKERPEHEVILVGDAHRVNDALAHHHGARPNNISVHHASEVVDMDEGATSSLRKKKDSSMRVCFDLVRDGVASGAVSAGNSGAMMALGLLTLGRIRGIERPAIATLFPALKHGRVLLLDAGANVECRPTHLVQFAMMGEAYVRKLLGVARPRVALLSNGEEESKGTALTREAAALLKRADLHYVGYAEGKDIFSGEVDVVVTDGFTGNVVLKTSEGAAAAVIGLVRSAIEKAGVSEKLGALLLKPTLMGLKKVTDYAEVGGAPLLGLDGVGIVAHGRSNAKAIKNALGAALDTAQAGLPDEIRAQVQRAASWFPTRDVREKASPSAAGSD